MEQALFPSHLQAKSLRNHHFTLDNKSSPIPDNVGGLTGDTQVGEVLFPIGQRCGTNIGTEPSEKHRSYLNYSLGSAADVYRLIFANRKGFCT